MKNLASILPDKAAMIVYWAEVFGFTNVRIYCDPNIKAFQILVSYDRSKVDTFSPALEGLLTDKLGCYTDVLVEAELNELYEDFILAHSTGLTELNIIEKLYGVDSLTEIFFLEIPFKDDDLLYIRKRKLAERILKEKNISYNSNNPSTLFQASSSEKSPPQSSNKEKSSSSKRQNDSTIEHMNEKLKKIFSPS